MNTVDVIDGAINHIESYGWCKGYMFGEEGQACMRGALLVGAGVEVGVRKMDASNLDEDIYVEASNIVDRTIREQIGWTGSTPMFNDEASTTQEDVILMLKHAREKASADLRN